MSLSFGLAIENFTSAESVPDIDGLVNYATKAEELGYVSLFGWDHLFLGSRTPFPQLEVLTTLAILGAHTSKITLGTGILALPIRDPSLLAKTAATIQMTTGGRLRLGLASGWYEREFQATGTGFKGRGKIFERNLEICMKLWTEAEVTGQWDDLSFRRVKMLPLPTPRPQVLIGGYVDRVLRRVGTLSDGWLTYFYPPAAFADSWAKIKDYAREAGRDPEVLRNVAQLPLLIGDSREVALAKAGPWLASYFDTPEWSDATPDSAVCGTAEQCAELIMEYKRAGVQEICFVPVAYDLEQVERFTADVLPLVREMEQA